MARFIVGDQKATTFRYESGTYATASGANNWLGLVQNHDIDENVNVTNMRYAGTTSRTVQQFVDGQVDVNGTLTYLPQNFRMLKFVLGSCVDGGSPSPFVHNYLPNANNASAPEVANMPLAPFTLVEEEGVGIAGSNFVRTLNGCIANTWSLSFTQGEPATCELGYTAQNSVYSSGAATNISGIDTTRPFMFQDIRLHLPSGTTINELKNGTLTLNNNLDINHYVDGNRTIAQPVPTNLDIELVATINATAENTKTLYDQYFLGGSTMNLLLALSKSTGSAELFITLSGAKLVDMGAPSPAEGVHEQTLTFQAGSIVAQENSLDQYYNFGSYAGF